MQELQEFDALIAIVDDDPSARQGLQRLVRSVGWKAETFASAQEFLARPRLLPRAAHNRQLGVFDYLQAGAPRRSSRLR